MKFFGYFEKTFESIFPNQKKAHFYYRSPLQPLHGVMRKILHTRQGILSITLNIEVSCLLLTLEISLLMHNAGREKIKMWMFDMINKTPNVYSRQCVQVQGM